METFFEQIATRFPFFVEYRFLLIFVIAVIEGLNTMVLGGFLVSVGKLPVWPTPLVLLAAHVVSGYIWYGIGFFGGSKVVEWWASRSERRHEMLMRIRGYFGRYSGRAILITKMLPSITIMTLLLAGYLKYNLKRFSLYSFIGSAMWVTATFSIGYFFGAGALATVQHIGYMALFFIAAIALIYIVRGFLIEVLIQSMSFAEHMHRFNEKMKEGISRFLFPDEK